MYETRKMAYGTEMSVTYPWGRYHGGRALCTDGKVRRLSKMSDTADTFFSIPASVKVGGKSVSGYVTLEMDESDNEYLLFIAYQYGRNGHLLPGIRPTSYPPE